MADRQCTPGMSGVPVTRGGSRIPWIVLLQQSNRTGTVLGLQTASLILTLTKSAGTCVILTQITWPLGHRRASMVVWPTLATYKASSPALSESPPLCSPVKLSAKRSFLRCHTERHRVHWRTCHRVPSAMLMKTYTSSRYGHNPVASLRRSDLCCLVQFHRVSRTATIHICSI